MVDEAVGVWHELRGTDAYLEAHVLVEERVDALALRLLLLERRRLLLVERACLRDARLELLPPLQELAQHRVRTCLAHPAVRTHILFENGQNECVSELKLSS